MSWTGWPFVHWLILWFGFWSGFVPVAFAQSACSSDAFVLGQSDRTVPINIGIRLSDPNRRTAYARALSEELDRIYVEGPEGALAANDARLSSLVIFASKDPANVRYFLSLRSQYQRADEIRRRVFGSVEPGLARPSAPDWARDPLVRFWSRERLATIVGPEWLANFVALSMQNPAKDELTELWTLQQNSGDATAMAVPDQRVALFGLENPAIPKITFVLSTGERKVVWPKSFDDALLILQNSAPQLCFAYIEVIRAWFYRPFINDYARLYTQSTVHSLGQVKMWDTSVGPGMGDPSIFSLLDRGYFVQGMIVRPKADSFTVDSVVVSPLRLGEM